MMEVISRRHYLPRTGQTTSYETGDDGDVQAGNPITTRFIDNGNGTISDRATGPQWVKQPELIIPGATGVHATNQIQSAEGNWQTPFTYEAADLIFDAVGGVKFYVCAVGHDAGANLAADIVAHPTYWRETVWNADATTIAPAVPATMAGDDAVAACVGSDLGGTGLSYAGFDDWRLPNISELFSVAMWGEAAPWPPLFVNNQIGTYWSSSPHPTAGDAWLYYITYTAVKLDSVRNTAIANLYYVRPVRGGPLNG